jgi:glutamate dehydrogenase/leucine dehydrogenase
VYAGLEEIMSEAAEKVIKTSVEKNIDMRTAAFVNAINALHEYYALVGIRD